MPYYRQLGEVPAKRHTQFRKQDGSLYTEELMGEEGFNYDSALLYHVNPPTGISSIEAVEAEEQATAPNIRCGHGTSGLTSSRRAATR